ncbi:MAG: leucine-rich repeat protein [Oscillospiraceae bacterium]|nr:leucine-rich repeat protein [Oscillospiraceae bacterium]
MEARAYTGKGPYIFISFHPDDQQQAEQIIQKMQYRGLRVWFDSGIAPGIERDEAIAESIENCGSFIALLSESYLQSLDTVDELNFARDLDKEQTLVYLTPAELPVGIRMRMSRLQSIPHYDLPSDDALIEKILSGSGINRFYGIEDRTLAAEAEALFQQLESYYPEHLVFALDNIDPQLREKIAVLCSRSEFDSVDDLMTAYGFSRISGEDAKQYRRSVGYLPGSEPAIIQRPLRNAIQTLEEYYPDHIIADQLPKLHRNVYDRLLALHQWLGYPDLKEFLSAYGYQYLYDPTVGRAAHSAEEYQAVLDNMSSRYADGEQPETMYQLLHDFPQYRAVLKTMQNNAYALYGTTLRSHLIAVGILREREQAESIPVSLARALEAVEQRVGEDQFESVISRLDGMSLRVNKAGQIYIRRADDCGEEVDLPDIIDFIQSGAFEAQLGLRRIVIPSGCSEIGENTFRHCDSLEEVVLPEGLSRIEPGTFESCSSLREITIPASVQKILPHAFLNCSSLDTVHLLNPKTSIYTGAFEGCPFTPPRNHPDNVEFLYSVDRKNRATITGFRGSAEILEIPDLLDGHPVVGIEKGTFAGRADLREVSMGDSISQLPGDVFRDCVNLERVHISNAVSKLIPSTFSGCSALLEVNIPDALTELKRNTFKDAQLEALHIGNSIRLFDPNAFFKGEFDLTTGKLIKAKSIRSIDVSPENPWLRAQGTCVFSADGKTLICDLGDTAEYVIPDGVEEIGDSAFMRNPHLVSVTFPNSLRKIGVSAFAETGLSSVSFPPSLETVCEKAFSFCRSLQEAVFPEGLAEIGDQAFEGCPVRSVVLPASLRQLGKNAFPILSVFQGEAAQDFSVAPGNPVYHTDGLVLYRSTGEGKALVKGYSRDLRLRPEGIMNAGVRYAVEPGTTIIEENAFFRCGNLTVVVFPDSLKSVAARAFMECSRLEKADLPPDAEADPSAFLGAKLSSPDSGDAPQFAGNTASDKISRIPVVDDNLLSMGYNAGSGTLEVEFKSHVVYQYFNVPESVWLELEASPEPGKYYYHQIRSRFLSQRID